MAVIRALLSLAVLISGMVFSSIGNAAVTRLEETHPSITYQGTWTTVSGAAVSGGGVKYASAADASVTVNFTGTGIAWISYRCNCAQGRAQVYIDGVFDREVNAHSPGIEAQARLYAIGGLTDAPHVLTIKVVGQSFQGNNTNVVIDAFDVQGGGPAGLIEEGDFAVSYTGTWTQFNDPGLSGGSLLASADTHATATVYFYGTGIAWIGYRCPCTAGIAALSQPPNGEEVASVQKHTYAPGREPQAEIHRIDGLPNGPHILRIRVTGDSVGDNPWIALDAFRVLQGPGGGGGDSTPPTISMTSPEANALVTGTVTISATANDNVGVTKVQFFARDRGLIGEDTTPPYSFTRDTNQIPSRSSFFLYARAIDAAGNIAVTPARSVTVQHEDRTRPLVTITSPAAGSTVSGTINLAASATDNQGIDSVRFWIDGHGYLYYPNAPVTSPPYAMQVNTLLLTDGTHTFEAIAHGNDGNSGSATPVTVTVDNSVQPGMVRVDDDDPAIVFSGPWSLETSSILFHWQSAARSSTPGATATFTFEGTGVRWLSLGCRECGYATASIDGGTPQLIDLNSGWEYGSEENRVGPAYQSPVLANGRHTLTITVVEGTPRPWRLVFVDGFEVLK